MAHPHLLNRYAYANNNPLRYIDPTGMDSTPANSIIGSMGAIYTLMGYGLTANAAVAFIMSFSSVPTNQIIKQDWFYSNSVFLYQELLYKNANGTTSASNPWDIEWVLRTNSPSGGWIVQQVTITTSRTSDPITYWEALEVKPGSNRPASPNSAYDDRFIIQNNIFGNIITYTYSTEARFYEGLQLPNSFIAGSLPRRAGDLHATEINPNLPIDDNATAPVIRTWTYP